MSLMDFHPDQYREIKNRAFNARLSLDTPARPNLAIRQTSQISDCLINPTRGLIASHDYLNAENINYPKFYGRNFHIMKKIWCNQVSYYKTEWTYWWILSKNKKI